MIISHNNETLKLASKCSRKVPYALTEFENIIQMMIFYSISYIEIRNVFLHMRYLFLKFLNDFEVSIKKKTEKQDRTLLNAL